MVTGNALVEVGTFLAILIGTIAAHQTLSVSQLLAAAESFLSGARGPIPF